MKREHGMIGYDPFGKPGAGAPNRDENGRSQTLVIYRVQNVPLLALFTNILLLGLSMTRF